MAAAGASKDAGQRSQTPIDFALVKGVRYEETADGRAPLHVDSINTPSSGKSPDALSSKRPRTSPSPSPRTPTHLSNEVKRDSGIAPSLSTTGRASYAESNLSTSALGAAKEPSLPTIVVQDDEPASTSERSRSPFARRKSKDNPKPRAQSAPKGVKRLSSFKGIQSDIPSGSLADIEFGDLASDKVGFSKRGSLLFGGKKMNPPSEPQGSPVAPSFGSANDGAQITEATPNADQSASQGLVAGRRKPSIQMLQTALQGGRVLSAEELTFSMRVRSMYEHGDEGAADWTARVRNSPLPKETTESLATGNSTPEPSIDGIIVEKTRQVSPVVPQRSLSPDVRATYNKEPTELAGGIEDWEDITGQDVDRYGFISPKRVASRDSTAEVPRSGGLQRVATSLQVESENPRGNRKLRRGPSSAARSARSVPPRPSNDQTVRAASLRSNQTHKSAGAARSSNPFRSRDRKAVADASDMLTLPPGLADIAEQEDAGRTASALKRKEWEREEKWKKMAQPMPQRERERSHGKGGGMRFEFQTSDQKLVSRTWKGIPDRWRATAWHSFLATSAKKRGIGASEDELVLLFHKLQEESSADDVQIDVDVPRTISMHIMFRRRYRGGQRLLFRVLHAISLYFPDVGYVQGMASLAATLLCYFDEERAFVMMVRLWQLRGLEQLFQSGFEGLMNALNEFEKEWLRDGDIARKLEELGITSTAYGTRWYLTLFNMSIPFPAQLRVWDVFMLLGDAPKSEAGAFGGADLDVLHATSAALIDATREIVLNSDFENTMKVLTSFVPIRDEDLLMRVARVEWKQRKKRADAKT